MTSYALPPINFISKEEAEKLGVKFYTPESPDFEAIAATITPLNRIKGEPPAQIYITAPISNSYRRTSRKGVDEL